MKRNIVVKIPPFIDLFLIQTIGFPKLSSLKDGRAGGFFWEHRGFRAPLEGRNPAVSEADSAGAMP